MAASQSVIQAYMERHRIRALFEELMNKILRDMPEEPLVYLLRSVYKKAGMEIPQAIRYGGLRKSTSELQRSISPERRSRSAVVSTSADLGASRLRSTSPTRLTKAKDGPRNIKQKPEWNPDNKTKSSFEELWEQSPAGKKEIISKASILRKSTTKPTSTSASAWATLGLGEDGEVYTSPAYGTHRQAQGSNNLTEEELLALESVKQSSRAKPTAELPSVSVSSSRHYNNNRKMESLKHKKELGQLLSETDRKLTDSGIGLGQLTDDDDEDVDAVELLENGEDLKREGVKNIPTSGYKLSKNVRYRENEPCMKLSINTYVYAGENADRTATPETERFSSDAEDEFESVSQVTGPRQPVWTTPDSDVITGDAIPLRPSYSATRPHRSNVQHKNYTEKSLTMTAPAQYLGQTVDSPQNMATGSPKTWSAGEKLTSADTGTVAALQSSRSGHSLNSSTGWRLPDDTEAASAYDWTQRVRGGPARDPRAY